MISGKFQLLNLIFYTERTQTLERADMAPGAGVWPPVKHFAAINHSSPL